MKLNLRQLNADDAIQNGSETTVAEKQDVDYSAFEQAENTLEAAFTGKSTKVEKPVANTEKPAEEKAAETKPEGEVKTEGAGAETSVLRFKEDLSIKDGELTIISLAKELGMEVAEDNFAALKKAYDEKVESVKKESWSGNFMAELEKEPVEVQEAYLLAKSGKSAVEIERPVVEIDGHLAKSNYELVKADLEAQGYSEEATNAKLEELLEANKIDSLGNNVRSDLTKIREDKIKERTEFFNNLKAKEQTRINDSNKRVQTALEQELKDTKEFLGLPLHETVGKGIIKNFLDGKYDDMKMPNTKKFLKAILNEEFGEMAVNELRQKAQSKIIQKTAQELHNTPPIRQGANGKPIESKKDAMDSLEDQFKRK